MSGSWPAMGHPARTLAVKDAGDSDAGAPDRNGRGTPTKSTGRGKRAAAAVPEEPEPEPDQERDEEPDRDIEDPQVAATSLLVLALRLGHEKDDADWLHSSMVKSQMKRMDPSFSEKALGYRSFSDFLRSRNAVAELDETSPVRLVRLDPATATR